MAAARETDEWNHVDGDPPPGDLAICGLIAEEDYIAHRGRWSYDPSTNPRNAERKIWNLIRPLKENDDRVLRKARARRYPALYALYLGRVSCNSSL